MFARRIAVDVPTDGAGAATVFSAVFNGQIRQLVYVADGSTPYDNTVDFTITLEATGEGLWTESNISASKSVAPRIPTHDLVGAAALYAAGGTAIRDYLCAADDRVKFVLAQGGATKTGRFYVVVA